MDWAQPLGSFFPLGFLTQPDREPHVDVVFFSLFLYPVFVLEPVRV